MEALIMARTSKADKARLLAAIPVDRICKGCTRVYLDTDLWRLTVFGDAVCIDCLQRDKEKYPDLYSDPLLKHDLWQNALAEVKKRRVTQLRTKQFSPQTVCSSCARTVRTSDKRINWIWLEKFSLWVCRKCWFKANDIEPGQYRQDSIGRVFIVTDQIKR